MAEKSGGLVSRSGSGAMAGLIATAPMTGFMLLMHQLLPNWQKTALPPEKLTNKVSKRLLKKRLGTPERQGVTLGTHFGYGAASGTVYGLTFSRLPLPAFLKGAIFGVLLWAAGYLGWIPAMDLLPSATKAPPQRSLLMIGAHLVFGITLAQLFAAFNTKDENETRSETETTEVSYSKKAE